MGESVSPSWAFSSGSRRTGSSWLERRRRSAEQLGEDRIVRESGSEGIRESRESTIAASQAPMVGSRVDCQLMVVRSQTQEPRSRYVAPISEPRLYRIQIGLLGVDLDFE